MMRNSQRRKASAPDIQIGLKLFSTNTALLPGAIELWDDGLYQYIELYIIPGSFEKTSTTWKNCRIPYVIHAPHSEHGVNLSIADQWGSNRTAIEETQRFTDCLDADTIIVHGGHTGSIQETIRQIALLNDKRICLENKPKFGLNNERCVGFSPEEFQMVSDAGVLAQGTVLDFGHAVCAAFSLGIPHMALINSLCRFDPRIYHLSDGYIDSGKDVHLNLGKGLFDIEAFISIIPKNGFLTLETPRVPERWIDDFVADVDTVSKLYADEV